MDRYNEASVIYEKIEELMNIMTDCRILRSTKRSEIDRFARFMWLLGKTEAKLERRVGRPKRFLHEGEIERLRKAQSRMLDSV